MSVTTVEKITGITIGGGAGAGTDASLLTTGTLDIARIAAGTVTLAKQANLAANSIQGNNTGSAATPLALTVAQTKSLLAIASSDVSGLAASATTDTTVATNIASGTLAAARVGDLGANPSASIGLTAVNGVATSYVRSDGAPAIDQTIAPTWTATHSYTKNGTFSAAPIYLNSSQPAIGFRFSGAGTDGKMWGIGSASANIMRISAINDGLNTSRVAWSATRSNTNITITAINYGDVNDRPPHTFQGNIILANIGDKLQVKEGTNASMGVATLVGGTVVVSNTLVTANSRIYLTAQSLGTVAVPSGYGISARTAGTSFTILASAPTDTSVIAWHIVEPGP